MKMIQKRARMVVASLLAAVLLPWSGAVPASASSGGSILAAPYPNMQDVAYDIQFTASEAIPASPEGSLSVEFPAAYSLPDEALFAAGTIISSELAVPGGDTEYSYYDIVNVSVDPAAEAPTVQFELSDAIPPGSAVTIRMWEEVGIDNPDSGSYTFYVGRTDGSLTAIPFEIISGASVSQFTVASDDNGRYLSNYSGYSNLSTYTFQFTPATALSSGDRIQVKVPDQYSYDNAFYWSPASIRLDKTSVTLNGGEAADALSGANTDWDDYGYPALTFTLNRPIEAGTDVAITLSNFLITPDRVRATPGPAAFELTTSKDLMPKAFAFNLYSRSVTDFYPDADSYTVTAASGYQFSFTVMQPIATDTRIAITFPAGMLPETLESVEPDKITINGVPAASASIDGSQLFLTPSAALSSFTTASIAIAESAGIHNAASPGFHTFKIQPESDMLPAERDIGFIPAEGSSLNGAGHGSLDSGGALRFRFPVHTILKGGDTITITSPEGTLLTDEGITVQDIGIEPLELDPSAEMSHPVSLERPSGNKLTFTLPPGYRLDPDYAFTIRIPNIIASEPGNYVFTIATSQETIPLAFNIMNDPSADDLSYDQKALIDADRDGLHMDDIVRFIKAGEGLDLNHDGRFDNLDMQMLLAAIEPLSEW
ncbi:hypothetical protein D3P08_16160 [Paenibacillus nanensis]|uniref:Dockerin domain-containing protein n=1 Tax=Paenibacillus nanensis TaxID=393251 RepID=A0A3A1V1I6_9BACL|nr:hypothetical protein [Paenibacillus nanensis]RIX51450.1 hypothetical protein D3P08_16160 [Paenibacillus nanensis]